MEEISSKEERKEQSTWNKLVAFLLILGLCFFVGNIVLVVLAMLGGLSFEEGMDIFAAISNPDMRPYIKTGIGLNHLIIFTGTSVLFAYWLRRKKWVEYFPIDDIDFSMLFRLLLLLVVAYPLIGASTTIFENVEWANQMDESSIEALMSMLQMDSFLDLLVNLIIVALLPALGEELLFRGIIQKELIGKMKNHHLAIIIASIIFSGVHLQIQGFLPKFILGMIMGYAYYWTQSLLYPIVIHFVNNGMQTVILYSVGDKMEEMQEQAIQPEISHLIILIGFSCFLCYLIIRDIQKQIDKKTSPNA